MAKLIPIIGAAVAALVIGAGAAWFLKPAPPPAEPVEPKEHVEFPGFTYQVKDRVVNLADAGARRYLKVSIAFEVPEEPAKAKARKAPPTPAEMKEFDVEFGAHYQAKINDVLTSVLSSKRSEDVTTQEGRERIREELRARINAFLPKEQQIAKILLTEFIIQ
jgi:flagellar FliL protein